MVLAGTTAASLAVSGRARAGQSQRGRITRLRNSCRLGSWPIQIASRKFSLRCLAAWADIQIVVHIVRVAVLRKGYFAAGWQVR